jgi:endonuclease IV
MERQKVSLVKKNQNHIRINGFRKEKDEPNKQHLEIGRGVLKLHNTIRILKKIDLSFLHNDSSSRNPRFFCKNLKM